MDKRKRYKYRQGLSSLFLWVFIQLLLSGTMGCGDDKLLLSLPDGDQVPWGGSIDIVADISEQGYKPADGSLVKFATTVGSFVPYEEHVTETPVREKDVATAGGQAVVKLFSFPGEGGESGTVSAAYTTINGLPLNESIPVSIAPGGVPSGKYLSAQCDPLNVQALNANGGVYDPDMSIRCTLSVKDALGKAVPIADIRVVTEGGCSMEANKNEDTGATHVFTLKADCVPADVEPMDGEPSHMFGGIIHNPRDGILSILFYVHGQEGFNDSNANGIYDPGEGFVGQDQPEPFLDINDDGQWNPGEDFIDNNNNGQWDPADGRWNDDAWIWTSTRIMFTGPPNQSAETTRFSPAGIQIDDAGTQTFTLSLMDQNHNPIAANADGDYVDFAATDVTVSQGNHQALEHVMGAVFANGVLDIESLSSNRQYQVTLQDLYPGDENPHNVSLKTHIAYTVAPSYGSYFGEVKEVDLSEISGTAN